MKSFVFGIILFLFSSGAIHAQGQLTPAQMHQRMDSLNRLVRTAKSDTAKIRLYMKLADLCEVKDNLVYGEPLLELIDKLLSQTQDPAAHNRLLSLKVYALGIFKVYYESTTEGLQSGKGAEYLQKMIGINKEVSNLAELTEDYMQLADHYSSVGMIMKQWETYQEGMNYLKSHPYNKGLSRYFVQMTWFSADQGDTAQALEYAHKAEELERLIADSTRLSRGYYLHGLIYERLHRYHQAVYFYFLSNRRYETERDTNAIVNGYIQLGNLYEVRGMFDSAHYFMQLALEHGPQKGGELSRLRAMINMGDILRYQGNSEKALEMHLAVYSFAQRYQNEFLLEQVHRHLAGDYYAVKDYAKARKYSDLSLNSIRNRGVIANLRDGEQLAYQIDSADGHSGDAFKHYYNYIRYRDKLKDDEIHRASLRQKFQSDYEQKARADKAEQEKKDEAVRTEARRQRWMSGLAIGGLLIVLIIAVIIFRSLRITRKQKHIIEQKEQETQRQKYLLEEKNTEITDSINYARRIQQSFLPDLEEISKALPESFVLFKPKDIVSGDFYWFHKGQNLLLLAAADCTGHGVPGAFMSMLNSDKLNEAVQQTTDVASILSQVNRGVKKALRQSGKEDSSRDGMDIALCSIEHTSTGALIEYAGANRPLWIIRAGGNEIEETKPTKTAIGGLTHEDQEFARHRIELRKEDTFYLFSDGFADQFGQSDKKLMTRRFKETLLKIQNRSLPAQKQYLESFLEDWKGQIEQTDDVLVIGVRV